MAARDDMNVKVRDALADDVVDGNERPFGAHGILHSDGQNANVGENGVEECGRKIGDGAKMALRYQQGMPREKRAVIEEGKRASIFKNENGIELVLRDFAEDAITACHGVSASISAPALHFLSRIRKDGQPRRPFQRGQSDR